MISVKNLTKTYGNKTVYENFNLDIKENKVLAVLGESGSGKTTLLKILANLTDYSGEVVGRRGDISMVFQRDLLIPNLTVKENLRLVCKDMDVESELEKVGLKGAENLYPKDLSAGMSRRVAILRALFFKSDMLLMDEPFVNLDLGIKRRLIEKMKTSFAVAPRTTVLVTHSIMEAVSLADRIILLREGKIIEDISEITKKTEEHLFSLMTSFS